jgi:hypothetical protein
MNPKEAAAGSEGHDRCRVPIRAYTAHTIRTTLKLQEYALAIACCCSLSYRVVIQAQSCRRSPGQSWAAVSYNLYTF